MRLGPDVKRRLGPILEDCVDQLVILGHTLAAPLVSQQPDAEHPISLTDRFEKEEKEEELGIKVKQKDGVTQPTVIHRDLMKLQTDRGWAQRVLEELLGSLGGATSSVRPLVLAVQAEARRPAERRHVAASEAEARRRLEELSRYLQLVRDDTRTQVLQRAARIARLKDDHEETKVRSGMEERYCRRSSETRCEFALRKLGAENRRLGEATAAVQRHLDQETRVNVEIDNFFHNYQKMLEEKVEEWMNKYDADIEAIEEETASLKSLRADNFSKLQALAQKYTNCMTVIEEERERREREKREEERQMEVLRATLTIQSWWRYVMRQRGLGRYRKKRGARKKGRKTSPRRVTPRKGKAKTKKR